MQPAQERDSGIASLATMLQFYGIAADRNRLAHECAGKRFGTHEIVRHARRHGLKAHVRKVRRSRLDRAALPAVVSKAEGGYEVLARVGTDKVLLHDPVLGV